ncbi:MAG: ATP-dependent helicase HrpB [Sorangiineae bacterium]|nr:ATP-dependent helicase HrpB [Polyangiaceae bacterium]MEB2324592.1 ATP-dependent helicase HrpB [Sorangiineae bacterium]
MPAPLPIDPLLPALVSELTRARRVVVEAPPGAGKTTRVPAALLEAEAFGAGEILVSEPRRLAARLAAARVAEERGEAPGGTIGYSVRFEDRSSPATRVRFVTEGVLVRRLLAEPRLDGVSAVILDEFHERHLETDLALALVRRAQEGLRPDLALAVMSATLETAPVAEFLGGCPILTSDGRLHPITIEHLPGPDDRPLERQVASAVRRLVGEEPSGDLLVFLPGAAEIRRAAEALEKLAAEAALDVLPLHGELPLAAQARAVEPGRRRKVVLSTNVAESSITVDGVTTVIDSGLARLATHSPFSGLPRLELARVSRASATQRAGRAGRTRPGRVLRLYTRADYETRPAHELPEALRADLAEATLALMGAGLDPERDLAWLDAPPPAARASARTLLGVLGALDASGRLTPVGRRLLDFPLHPRLARVVAEGERRGIASEAALAAALLAERDVRRAARPGLGEARRGADGPSGPSDVLELAERFEEARRSRFATSTLRHLELDAARVRAVERARAQLARLVRTRGEPPKSAEQADDALRRAVLAGFIDRVARRRRPGARELVLANGRSAELSPASVVTGAPLMVALDADEQRGRSVVRLASAIDAEWLLDDHADQLASTDEFEWNPGSERVERVSRLSLGSVVLEESRAAAPPSDAASRVLERAVLARGAGAGGMSDGLALLVGRLALLREHFPELGLPDDSERGVERAFERAVAAACRGRTSLRELEGVELADELARAQSPHVARALREHAPDRLRLPGGRSTVVHYEPGKPPFIESRLQDFFGMKESPRVCAGRVALTVHLLAPNGRAVQVTSDLAGFWERHYPSIRRELGRRYPRHAWPEDGRTAAPPAPRPPRTR